MSVYDLGSLGFVRSESKEGHTQRDDDPKFVDPTFATKLPVPDTD